MAGRVPAPDFLAAARHLFLGLNIRSHYQTPLRIPPTRFRHVYRRYCTYQILNYRINSYPRLFDLCVQSTTIGFAPQHHYENGLDI